VVFSVESHTVDDINMWVPYCLYLFLCAFQINFSPPTKMVL